MGFNKALVLKRFSIDNWIDYGRSKYYLDQNNWDIEVSHFSFHLPTIAVLAVRLTGLLLIYLCICAYAESLLCHVI